MRPNIIFYFSDQQRWDTVNEEATPNLMQLAREGIQFENSYTCQPVCGPARACLQTGMYATQCGCYWNGVPLPQTIRPMAEYFNEAGYETAYVGKWHLASDRLPNVGFHCEKTAIPKERQGGYKNWWRAADVLEFTSHGYDGYVFDAEGNQIDFKGYRADCINDFALEYLDQKTSDDPFFLFISQLEPHHQNDRHCYEGPKETVEKFRDYPIPPDLSFLEGDYEKMYPDYMAAINRLDENVGRLVARLKEKGLYENTILITDGEDHEGNVMQAAERAAEQGIRIFTIGIGTPEGAPIQIGGEFIKDDKGEMVVSKLGEPLLEKIAQATDGAYIRSTNQSIGLDEIVRTINNMEKGDLAALRFEEFNEQFQYLIGAALVLLLLEFLLLDRRNPLLRRFNIFGTDTEK